MSDAVRMFAGFAPATFSFFSELSENNCKPWFESHREIYEKKILFPMRALVTALTPTLSEIDPGFDLRPNKIVSRIYRDIRFSKDKSPYKTSIWINIQRIVENWMAFPGFFLEINERGAEMGMGLFDPGKKVMDRYRLQVEYEKDHFREITEALVRQKKFILRGEGYKRLLKNDLDEYFQSWVQKKNIYLSKSFPRSESMYSYEFVQMLRPEFLALKPLYEFWVDICE